MRHDQSELPLAKPLFIHHNTHVLDDPAAAASRAGTTRKCFWAAAHIA